MKKTLLLLSILGSLAGPVLADSFDTSGSYGPRRTAFTSNLPAASEHVISPETTKADLADQQAKNRAWEGGASDRCYADIRPTSCAFGWTSHNGGSTGGSE